MFIQDYFENNDFLSIYYLLRETIPQTMNTESKTVFLYVLFGSGQIQVKVVSIQTFFLVVAEGQKLWQRCVIFSIE